MSDLEPLLWALIEPYLAAEGVELDDLQLLGTGPRRILRVTVDAEGGVTIDRIAKVSRNLSRLLDASDPVPGSYTLEVSSPGLERELRRPSHFRKAVGREVVVKARNGHGTVASHRGVLVEAREDQLVIEVDGNNVCIEVEAVTSARTVFELPRAPKPGQRR